MTALAEGCDRDEPVPEGDGLTYGRLAELASALRAGLDRAAL